MKKFLTNLFAAIGIFGVLLAGAESSHQLITCTLGLCLFASGFYGIAAINRD
jgi:hypothetical protein